MSYHHATRRVVLLASALAAIPACGEEDAAPAGCPVENQIGGVCAGVPAAPLCDGDFCVAGVACAETIEVRDAMSLQPAIERAAAGTCIALAPGSYGTAVLPGGVSLLGRWAGSVSVAGVWLRAGEGAVVRGITVGGGGIVVDGATSVRIASVLASRSKYDGIAVRAGSSVSLITSTVEHAERYGLNAVDPIAVSVEASVFAANSKGGIFTQCLDMCAGCLASCDCEVQPSLSARASVVRDNHMIGVQALGVSASLDNVDILDTKGDLEQFQRHGEGLAAQGCARLAAKGLRVRRNSAYGALIDKSDATLGEPGEGEGVDISGNTIGIWVRNVLAPQKVVLENSRIEGNAGVGVGVSGDSKSFIICSSSVTGTTEAEMNVYANVDSKAIAEKLQSVGHGLVWFGASRVDINNLTLSGNALASVVIHGSAEGTLANVVLQGGDESKGIVQQSYSPGDDQPLLGANTPPLTTDPNQPFVIPAEPDAP